MSESPNNEAARWIPLIAVGICINTLGITLQRAGRFRFVLMGIGILIMLVALVKLLSIVQRQKNAP